jgi:hypothetical protein
VGILYLQYKLIMRDSPLHISLHICFPFLFEISRLRSPNMFCTFFFAILLFFSGRGILHGNQMISNVRLAGLLFFVSVARAI